MNAALGAIALATTLVGCAMAARSDRSPEAARTEIASLQERIARQREQQKLEAAPGERCRRLREVADEICRCSARICHLASRLGDDDSSRACAQGREDCVRATSAADGCN